MMRWYHTIILMLQMGLVFAIPSDFVDRTLSTQQVIIHFAQIPPNDKEHDRWIDEIEKAVQAVDRELIDNCSDKACDVVMVDPELGFVTVVRADNVAHEQFVNQLLEILKQKNVPVNITDDYPIYIAPAAFSKGLEGESLSLDQLGQLQDGTLIKQVQAKLTSVQQKKTLTKKERDVQAALGKRLDVLKRMKKKLFWHQTTPIVGMRNVQLPTYPFLPHYFSLWQLAPKKGAGISVAMIDTGVSAFSIKEHPGYRKNKDLDMQADFAHQAFNLVSAGRHDPLEFFAQRLKPYVRADAFDRTAVKRDAVGWILTYLNNKGSKNIALYLKQYAQSILIKNKKLNKDGKKALKLLLVYIKKNFNLVTLMPSGERVILELLPAVKPGSTKATFVTGHGSHTFGLVGGSLDNVNATTPDGDTGVCGIAPEANVVMIKAFADDGTSNKSTLIAAIKRAVALDVDVVNLSLKVSDDMKKSEPATQLLRRIINLIPYVVAASGNDGFSGGRHYPGRIESYPGRFGHVAFDVGSMGQSGDHYSISPFSQYERYVGPKVVAPGFNIISAGLVPNQKSDSEYLFLDGTSMSTPIISGFIALMLGEFKNNFTREQLLAVAYSSTCRLHDNKEWREKTLLGALDMRTALFTLHVLSRIKINLKTAKQSADFFDKKFDNLVKAIYYIIFDMADKFSKKNLGGMPLRLSMADYIKAAREKKVKLDPKEFYVPASLDEAIIRVADTVVAGLQIGPIKQDEKLIADVQVVQQIAQRESVDLFDWMHPKSKERITKVEHAHPYWQKQAKKIQALS